MTLLHWSEMLEWHQPDTNPCFEIGFSLVKKKKNICFGDNTWMLCCFTRLFNDAIQLQFAKNGTPSLISMINWMSTRLDKISPIYKFKIHHNTAIECRIDRPSDDKCALGSIPVWRARSIRYYKNFPQFSTTIPPQLQPPNISYKNVQNSLPSRPTRSARKFASCRRIAQIRTLFALNSSSRRWR